MTFVGLQDNEELTVTTRGVESFDQVLICFLFASQEWSFVQTLS